MVKNALLNLLIVSVANGGVYQFSTGFAAGGVRDANTNSQDQVVMNFCAHSSMSDKSFLFHAHRQLVFISTRNTFVVLAGLA